MDAGFDERLRAAAFAYLDAIMRASGGFVTRAELEAFQFEGQRIPLIERQRGIRKFRDLPAALSILTTYARNPERRPYDDGLGIDNYPRYKWQGTDRDAFDNRALRYAMESRTPLVWFIGIAPGVFEAHFPVWIVGEEPAETQFVLALAEELVAAWAPDLALEPHAPARLYARRIVKARLHQPVFRSRVLLAYERQCALCRLRHPELLEAAHIRRDSAGGEPIVPNGIAMCAIHHRAFDANILGIDPRHRVEIRRDVLEELDGPTLQHTLQGLHGGLLILPKRPAERPRPDLVEERYEEFRAAG
ncbi:MAG: HNH endonuclease [Actinomycetota bacterium]